MKARHYTYACMESGGASWRGDGWLEAGCLPQRQAEIHNLWRKILRLLCLSKSCKSLHLGFLLALGSLSLLQITHGDIFRGEKKKNPQSEECFFDLLQEFVRSQRWGRDRIAFMFNLRSAPTSKMHYLLHFCWFPSCSLWFILTGHVCKRSLLLSLIPILLKGWRFGTVGADASKQKSASLTNWTFKRFRKRRKMMF